MHKRLLESRLEMMGLLMKGANTILLGFCISVLCNCIGSSASNIRRGEGRIDGQNTNTMTQSTSIRSNWTRIPLPVEQAVMLSASDERLFAVGVDGIVEIDATLGTKLLDMPSMVSKLLTKDGGISFIPKEVKQEIGGDHRQKLKDLCRLESTVFVVNRLISFGPCEHTAQLWSFSLGREKNERSVVIDFTYSTFPYSDSDDPVYGPVGVVKVGNQAMLPSNLRSGPAILKLRQDNSSFDVIWRGKSSVGSILSIDFFESQGLMLTSKGQLLRSNDWGKTWSTFSQIPGEFVGRVSQLKFRDQNEAYIIGVGGIVLFTNDSGRTWGSQESNTKGDLYKIVVDSKRAALLADFKLLLVSDNNADWQILDFDRDRRIDDIMLKNGKVFVLSESTLYVQ